ncbi:hypothetical protein NEMBOFW57_003057 [Staphylotrichum longicolle]|uniref:Uncharacterized protein n=1 Tax=Staphylotrichum longicolle TaxID=669026 RepID=A0AAD4I2B1_9PEZI|nr:hypothetical protein NEMBOFW57_003057 [Staphylotrichum longicolle]
MRFTSIFLAAGLALFATAQTTTSQTAATTAAAADPAASSAQSEILRCLSACRDGDVACTSKCIAVPNPNESQVNATNSCVAACPQGNGTEAETKKYADCIQGCINTNYFNPTTGQPQPTGSASSGNNNGNNNNNNGGNGNGSGSNSNSNSPSGTSGGHQASGTTAGAAATSSTGAAGMIGVSGGLVGIVGLVAGVMAL